MNQLHTISGLLAVPVTSVVSISHTMGRGNANTRISLLGVCPHQVSIQLEHSKILLTSKDSLRSHPHTSKLIKNQLKDTVCVSKTQVMV